MSENLKKCMNKLVFIASIKNDLLRKKILMSLSDECLYDALQEIANNYKNKTIKLNPKTRSKLKGTKEKNILAFLKKKLNKKDKYKLIKQSGGWLPVIIPAVASILSSLIGN